MDTHETMGAASAFFDGLAPGWRTDAGEEAVLRRLVDLVGLPQGARVADLGCGTGVLIGPLLEAGAAKVLAVDLSAAMVALAKARADWDGRVEFRHGNLYDLDLPPLDAAFLLNSYPHFTDRPALAALLAGAVAPGGLLVVAHTASRHRINAVHAAKVAPALYRELRSPGEEAETFEEAFETELALDGEDHYLLSLRRKG